ncbi:site-2 protease family protein [Paenibacillus durus]|uniref:Zinc metalloprotease n=1 Tax=Paenibacillus durus ATCC 35681 TaxID=1333534 RepID=A0A0F7CJ13_PAEDU|nr:site-2 protease family protein [Paenibacillus durus]AKG35761.1 zinc metalloprotease [Paenibacillus durus ATCC 35681]
MDFLQNIIRMPLDQLPFFLVTILIAFTVHEFSHAYFANKFGDPTARLLGRMTLNPAVHFDFFGIILLLIAGFGWARPVPVNRDNFSRPRLMGIIVSLAGPVSNLLLAIIGCLIYGVLIATGVIDAIPAGKGQEAAQLFLSLFTFWNFFLFLFNLIPLPPLDGYRVIEDLAPRSILGRLQQFEQWAMFLFVLIVFIPALRNYTITPLTMWAGSMSMDTFNFFYQLFT